MLQATDSVGKSLGLCCPCYPETEIQVRQPEDFARLSPESRYQLLCDQQLSTCRHRYVARYHSESMYTVFLYLQACQQLYILYGHSCQKATCRKDCRLCIVRLDNIRLPCSYSKDNVPCYQAEDLSKVMYSIVVEKRVPGCRYVLQIQYWQDVSDIKFRYPILYKADLACRHCCPGYCSRCRTNLKDAG
jgi:hypothetical protein